MRKISFKPSQRTFDKEVYQNTTDLLLSRIKLLSGKDKLLLTMHLEKGNSFRQIAHLTGIHEGNIARRIHKLMRRLIEGEYITCVRNRHKFSITEMAIAKEYFLSGLSIREIAAKRHFTYYRARKILKIIQYVLASDQKQKSMTNSCPPYETLGRRASELIKLTTRLGDSSRRRPKPEQGAPSRSRKGQQLCLHTLSQKHSNCLYQQTGRDILPIKPLTYAECSA